MEPRSELCAELSLANGEALFATASRIDHWLLVEYRGIWTRDVLGGSGLSDPVKAHLREQLDALPRSRLLFIRRPERRNAPRLALFLARSNGEGRRFFGLELDSYDDLLSLDFAGALSGSGERVGEPLEHPLLVVCTHGKRDRCCAKFGQPLYDEVRVQVEQEWVWQSTHVGGDRFAGNLVCLPEGLYFGRVTRPDVWALLDEYRAGRIQLEHYRGRSSHAFPVQAAERSVRLATGLTGIDEVRLLGWERARGGWRVRLLAGRDDEVHELDVAVESGEPTRLTCCSPALQRPRRYVTTARRIHVRR